MSVDALDFDRSGGIRKMGSEVDLVVLFKGSLGDGQPMGDKKPVDIEDVQELFQESSPFGMFRFRIVESIITPPIPLSLT